MQRIYLDHNATTQPAPEVVAAMHEALTVYWQNPSSVHRAGQAVRQQIELARAAVATLIGARPRDIIFTSGGTEAADLAVRGSLQREPERNTIITLRTEHSCVRELAEALHKAGTEVHWLALDEHGLADLDDLRGYLAAHAERVAVVSTMWVNNETGLIQPVEAIGTICREHGVRFHVDATQAVGKLPMNVAESPVDLLSFGAHKFHGPKGIGGLYIRRGLRLTPQVVGGPQERELRAGTENVPGILGLGAAAEAAMNWLDSDGPARAMARRERFERDLLQRISDAVVNVADAPRLWSTSNIAFPRLEAEAILLLLSERGVDASAGAACSSGSLEPSPILRAMGVPDELAHGSVRFSFSRDTTDEELDRAVDIIAAVIEKLRATMAVV